MPCLKSTRRPFLGYKISRRRNIKTVCNINLKRRIRLTISRSSDFHLGSGAVFFRFQHRSEIDLVSSIFFLPFCKGFLLLKGLFYDAVYIRRVCLICLISFVVFPLSLLTHVHINICMCNIVYIHTCIHTYIYAYMHTYIVYIHTYIYKLIHTYIHTYLHIYTYIQV